MGFDYSKLKGKIAEVFQTQGRFAEALSIGRVSLSQRLNNKSDFSQSEMMKSAELLNLPKDQIPVYFFADNVQKSEQIHCKEGRI